MDQSGRRRFWLANDHRIYVRSDHERHQWSRLGNARNRQAETFCFAAYLTARAGAVAAFLVADERLVDPAARTRGIRTLAASQASTTSNSDRT